MTNAHRWFAAVTLGASLGSCIWYHDDYYRYGDWSVCHVNSECALAASSCCGVCGQPSLGDVDAVNRARQEEHYRDVCPHPGACPACVMDPNPNLHATCSLGVCMALDIRQQSVSACIRDEDCRLRVRGCCECGGSTDAWNLIAINASMEDRYEAWVCDPRQACAQCLPIYPSGARAYCATDGHCDLEFAR